MRTVWITLLQSMSLCRVSPTIKLYWHVSQMTYHLLILTGGRHGWSAGHADIRGVLRLLQDDVYETGPVPADDGVQRQEGSPDSGGAGQLSAQRAEGERSSRSRVKAKKNAQPVTHLRWGVQTTFSPISRFNLRSSHTKETDCVPVLPPSVTCLSFLPRGICSTKPIYHA